MHRRALHPYLAIGLAGLSLATAAPAAAPAPGLPADIRAAIIKEYDSDVRYLDASFDLNGDGKPEILVHVVGQMSCGTGGCPTMIFTPEGTGYRLVSTIGLTNPPVRVAAASTQGWRNLVVHVAGGGAKAGDVELAFNGRGYPENPTVAGQSVKRGSVEGAQVVIREFASFDEAKSLDGGAAAASPTGGATAPSATAAAVGAGPSFDCAASTPVEKLICSDAGLATLDRQLTDAYTKAMAEWPDADKTTERAAQRAWMTSRNDCAKGANVKPCVDSTYRRRLIEVQIRGGQLMVPTPVGYVCQGRESQPFTATYYNQTDPKSAVFTSGDRQVVALSVPSGSGARYADPDVEFWEHQGEATVTWSGATFVCKAR